MALPTASDNEFPKVILEEVATDGSATVTPAADHRALFLGEDGALHLKDSAAAVTDVGGSGGSGFVPIVLEPLIRNDQDAGWSTFVNVGASGNWFAYLQSSGAQNAELTFDPLDFEGGTYKVDLICFQASAHGIVHVQLGGTDLTTFDLYAAGSTPDQRMTNTGLAISAGTHTVSLQMATKNASSSNYFGLVNRVIFTRTA